MSFQCNKFLMCLVTMVALYGCEVDSRIKNISAGDLHTCARSGLGEVSCWGSNAAGQTTVPVMVGASLVAAGGSSTCSVDTMSGAACWGLDDNGQSTVPAELVNATMISSEATHACGVGDGGVACWGASGQIGTVPVFTNPVLVGVGSLHNCALDDNGVSCWLPLGIDFTGAGTVPAGLVDPFALAVGPDFTCTIHNSPAEVSCWGINDLGQTTVPELTNPRAISAGAEHACALDDNGVTCWGDNVDGQATVPGGLGSITKIATGGWHSCALSDIGLVTCWGLNDDGQSDVPEVIIITI